MESTVEALRSTLGEVRQVVSRDKDTLKEEAQALDLLRREIMDEIRLALKQKDFESARVLAAEAKRIEQRIDNEQLQQHLEGEKNDRQGQRIAGSARNPSARPDTGGQHSPAQL